MANDLQQLFSRWEQGDESVLDDLVVQVYPQMKDLAKKMFLFERRDHTIQTTGLVHEVFIRLKLQFENVKPPNLPFFLLVGRIMRQVLVDYGRYAGRQKRDFKAKVTFDDISADDSAFDLNHFCIEFDRLKQQFPESARVFELRYLVGLSVEETSAALQISERNVYREWKFAKSWLAKQILGGRYE